MPDTPVEPPRHDRYPIDMESRVAVLEEIARNTALTLTRIERRLDAVDQRFDVQSATQRADFCWLVGIMFGGFSATIAGFATMLGVMAHGFHWL
jgi:hypothetical protein